MGAECHRCGHDIYDECHYCKVKDERDRLRELARAVCLNPSEDEDYECVRASDLNALRDAVNA